MDGNLWWCSWHLFELFFRSAIGLEAKPIYFFLWAVRDISLAPQIPSCWLFLSLGFAISTNSADFCLPSRYSLVCLDVKWCWTPYYLPRSSKVIIYFYWILFFSAGFFRCLCFTQFYFIIFNHQTDLRKYFLSSINFLKIYFKNGLIVSFEIFSLSIFY